MPDADTFLESIATERDRRAAEWEHATRDERRALVLGKLAKAKADSRAATDKLAANQPTRYTSDWLLAAEIAASLGVPGARRLGRGAMGGHSWTGYMSPALRVVPSLRSAAQRGLVRMRYQPDVRTRSLYQLTASGLAWLQAQDGD